MEEIVAMLKPIYEAVAAGHWALGASLGVILAVTLLRRYGAKRFSFLASRPAGYLMSYAVSLAGTLATALSAGAPFDSGMLLLSGKIAFAASGVYELMKELILPMLGKFLPKLGKLLPEKLQFLVAPVTKWLPKLLEMVFDNSKIKEKAKDAGDKAVAEQPAGGLKAITGEAKEVN